MFAILALFYMCMDTGANSVRIQLTETYSYTSVELSCAYQSNEEVAVGYYQKLPFEKSFGRAIAVAGNVGNCNVTSLPKNIVCRCVSNRNVSCTVYNLTSANEGEEWKCAIPDTIVGIQSNVTVGIFSTVARISLQHIKATASNESNESITGSALITTWSTESDTNIEHDINVKKTQPSTEDRTKMAVIISSLLGSLILMAAVTVPLCIRYCKSREQFSEHMPTEEGSGPPSMVYNSTPQRYFDTADGSTLDSRYYIGRIARTASRPPSQVINSEGNIEDGTNQTEANGDTDHYSDISMVYNSIQQRCVDTADVISLDSLYDIGRIAGTASWPPSMAINSEANVQDGTNQTEANGDTAHYSVAYTDDLPPKVIANKRLHAECMLNMETMEKAAFAHNSSAVPTDDKSLYAATGDKSLYAECLPDSLITTKGQISDNGIWSGAKTVAK